MLGDLFLCASTIDRADLDTRIQAAREGGYAGIGLRPSHLDHELARGTSVNTVAAKLVDADLELVEIGFLADWWDRGTAGQRSRQHEDNLYRLRDALGGRHMMLIGGPLEQPLDEIAEAFAGVCDRAAEHGLVVGLEFLPWTDTDNITKAWEIIECSGMANAGIVLDTWHHSRGSGTNDDLSKVPADRIVAIQLSDGPLRCYESELDDTFKRRRLPGEGDFDLTSIFTRLAELGVRAPIGIEVLSDDLRALDPSEAARQAASATRRLIEDLQARST